MKFQNLLLTLLTMIALVFFVSCDDAHQMVSPALDSLQVKEDFSDLVSGSRYTAVLYRVGILEQFGAGVDDPGALEWNGTDLYMIAEHGSYPTEGEFLFRVDKQTGQAVKVNPGARDLGGSLTQGRGFVHTSIYGITVNDMAWDAEFGMRAAGHAVNRIVMVDLETGLASGSSSKLSFCIEGNDSELTPESLGYDRTDWYITARTDSLLGVYGYGLYRLSGNCVLLVSQLQSIGSENLLVNGVYREPHQVKPVAMCWDGQNMYVSDTHTSSLGVLDLQTGKVVLVGRWRFGKLPPGVVISNKNIYRHYSNLTEMPVDHDGREFGYWKVKENTMFDFPDITGIAFDGENLYAVDYFTDALYRVGKK